MPTVKEVDDLAQRAIDCVASVRREGFSDPTPDNVTATIMRLDALRSEISDFFNALDARRKHVHAAAADVNGVILTPSQEA